MYLSVSSRISKTTCSNFTTFLCLVLLWRQCNVLCTSGLVKDSPGGSSTWSEVWHVQLLSCRSWIIIDYRWSKHTDGTRTNVHQAEISLRGLRCIVWGHNGLGRERLLVRSDVYTRRETETRPWQINGRQAGTGGCLVWTVIVVRRSDNTRCDALIASRVTTCAGRDEACV